MKRYSLIRTISLLLLLAGRPFAAGQQSGTGASANPDHVALSWTGDPSTTMTITWRTDPSVSSGFVQYQKGSRLSPSAKKAKADAREFASDLGATRLFASILSGLSPNTLYSYRVGDGEHWSDVRSFTTAERGVKRFKFLVFGDSQSSVTAEKPYAMWRETIHNAYKANPDARFLVNVGDLVDYGQGADHWNAWFAAASGVIDAIPEMPATGNHETYGSKETTRPAYWTAQFTLPQNGPEGLKGQVYSYDYGPAHLVVLDSQGGEQQKYGDILKIQQQWLDADLAASKAKWKFVFFHKTPYGAMSKRRNEDVRAAFCPTLEKHHVDLVFNAHDHAVSRTHPIKDGVNMETAAQGTIYYISGRSGEKTYRNLEKMPWHEYFYDPQDQPTYISIEVAQETVTIRAVKQDGSPLDVFSIRRK